MLDADTLRAYGPTSIAFLGLILNALILLKAAMLATSRHVVDLEGMKAWKATHEEESAQRDRAIVELQKIAASSEATAKGQERRIMMLEEDRKHRRT